MEEIKIECKRKCMAKDNDGIHCMWKVNNQLIEMANDPEYQMCSYLRKKILSVSRGDSEIRELAEEALIEMGATMYTKGSRYIVDAISVIDGAGDYWKVCDVYRAVAAKNDAKEATVERCIRNSFGRIVTKGNLEVVEKYLSLVNTSNGSLLHTFHYRLTH